MKPRTDGANIVSILLLCMLFLGPLAAFAASCGGNGATSTSPTTVATSTLPRDVILNNRARAVFSSNGGLSSEFPENMITREQLLERLRDPARAEQLFLLDTRPRDEWDEQGHIEGATWFQLQTLADPESLEQIPKDKTIVCISPTGHTAAQVTAVLRWLGYDAILLKDGMAGWTPTPAGQLMSAEIEAGIARQYPTAKETPYTTAVPQEPVQALSQPPEGELPVLQDAAAGMLHDDVFEKAYPFNHIFAGDLYGRLTDPATVSSQVLVDIRPLEVWDAVGHIDMGDHILIDWRVLADPDKLAFLPKDRPVVVIGSTGQTADQATAILRMLGYNAVTLRSGMMSWTRTPDSQPTLDTIRSANYPVVK